MPATTTTRHDATTADPELRSGLESGLGADGRLVRRLGRALRAVVFDRPTRVRMMLAAVVAMSIVDLDMTLVYAKTTGMVESNPIAREIMQTGSVWLLVAWKFLTVTIAAGLLYRVRQHRAGELGAWLCLAIMLWLTARWLSYNEEVQVLQCAATSAAVQGDPRFVLIDTTKD
jgi:hypothetical protein